MLRFLGVLFGLILIGIGILAGGCSILFTPELFRNSEFGVPDILPVWAGGLAIAAVGIWGGIAIMRRIGRAQQAPATEDPPPMEPPPEDR